MLVGSGASFGPTGTGTVSANQDNGATIPASQTCLGSNSSSQLITGTCSGGGGGTTTNPLTMAASGGAGPGATFNGSAAVTQDYHTIGAGGIAAANTWSAFNTFGVGIDVSGNAELDGYVVYPCSGSSGNPTLDGTSINLLMAVSHQARLRPRLM